MFTRLGLACLLASSVTAVFGQNSPPAAQQPGGFKPRAEGPAGAFNVAPGTHILLNMINSVSSKQSQVGDRIYLETAFPVLSSGRIIIPQGSWVTGTVTQVKAPARGRRRGELQVRFDSLTLPNGVSRKFDSDLGAVDARDPLKHEHDKITSSDGKGGDVATVAGTTAAGAGIGTSIGYATGHAVRGLGIGAGAGAAAGMMGVLLAHGSDAVLPKGSTVEMVLDRPLSFNEDELNFSNTPPSRALSEGGTPAPQQRRGWNPRIPW